MLSLEAPEFLRRFLLHVLPRGFHAIRHYGLLANAHRAKNLALASRLIAGDESTDRDAAAGMAREPVAAATRIANAARCPQCNLGTMLIIEIVQPGSLGTLAAPATMDSS